MEKKRTRTKDPQERREKGVGEEGVEQDKEDIPNLFEGSESAR